MKSLLEKGHKGVEGVEVFLIGQFLIENKVCITHVSSLKLDEDSVMSYLRLMIRSELIKADDCIDESMK